MSWYGFTSFHWSIPIRCCFGCGCSSSCCIIMELEWSRSGPTPSLPPTKMPYPPCSLLLGELYNELAVVVAVVKEVVSRSFSQHSAADAAPLSMLLCCDFGPRELRKFWRWRCLRWGEQDNVKWYDKMKKRLCYLMLRRRWWICCYGSYFGRFDSGGVFLAAAVIVALISRRSRLLIVVANLRP